MQHTYSIFSVEAVLPSDLLDWGIYRKDLHCAPRFHILGIAAERVWAGVGLGHLQALNFCFYFWDVDWVAVIL